MACLRIFFRATVLIMARSSTLEDHVEAYLVKRVEALGGFSLKTDKVPGRRFLDRTCFLPGGVVIVVECKRPKGGRLEAHQAEIIARLVKLGHRVVKVRNKDEVDEVLGANEI